MTRAKSSATGKGARFRLRVEVVCLAGLEVAGESFMGLAVVLGADGKVAIEIIIESLFQEGSFVGQFVEGCGALYFREGAG